LPISFGLETGPSFSLTGIDCYEKHPYDILISQWVLSTLAFLTVIPKGKTCKKHFVLTRIHVNSSIRTKTIASFLAAKDTK